MDTAFRLLRWIVKLYTPPKPGDTQHLFQYHLAISVGVVGIWIVAWMAAAWLAGEIAFVPQVAWANEVHTELQSLDAKNDRISRQLAEIQLLGLESNISEEVKAVCRARKSGVQNDLDAANRQLLQLTTTYEQITGREYHISDCSTVLVGND